MTSAEVIARAAQERLAASAANAAAPGTTAAITATDIAEKWELRVKAAALLPDELWITGTTREQPEYPYTGIVDVIYGSTIRILVPCVVDSRGVAADRMLIEAVSLSAEDRVALDVFQAARGCRRVPAVSW
jgi:hypothetical protein